MTDALQSRLVAAASGALAGGAFLMAAAFKGGTLFLFLPFLPLFLVGFRSGFASLLLAGGAALCVIALSGDFALVAFFLILYALPAGLLVRRSLLWRQGPAGPDWYPVGRAVAVLAGYAVLLLGVFGFFYNGEAAGLEAVILRDATAALKDLPPDFAGAIETVVRRWPFLFLALLFVQWVLLLYGIAWFSHVLLESRRLAIRPGLALSRFEPPSWLLAAMAGAGLLSAAGSGDAEFIGKTAMIVLLLPYLLSGLALVHLASSDWPGRVMILTLIYLLLVTAVWVAAMVAFVGLADHCMTVGRRMSRR